MNPAELAALIILGGSVLAYAIGGAMHIAIDYVHGKRLLRKYWDATDGKIAAIETKVVGSLKNELQSVGKAPPVDFQPLLEQISEVVKVELQQLQLEIPAPEIPPLQVPPIEISDHQVELIGERLAYAMSKKGQGAIGGRIRSDQAAVVDAISSSVDFGNAILNGAWVMLPRETKLAALNKLVKTMRRCGFQVIPIATIEGRTVGEESAEETGLFALPEGRSRSGGRW
jgi:hypothetical protein